MQGYLARIFFKVASRSSEASGAVLLIYEDFRIGEQHLIGGLTNFEFVRTTHSVQKIGLTEHNTMTSGFQLFVFQHEMLKGDQI